jgi:hypothetical protein
MGYSMNPDPTRITRDARRAAAPEGRCLFARSAMMSRDRVSGPHSGCAGPGTIAMLVTFSAAGS